MSEPQTRFRVGRRDAGKRLDRFLGERIPGLSRSRIQRAIRERVELSWGVPARPSAPVRFEGVVVIGTIVPVEPALDLKFEILARGPGWLAIDKPPGLPVHPVNGFLENTVIRMIRRQLGEPELRLAHRLDRETSGVLLLAEDATRAAALSAAFRGQRVRKRYSAIVVGRIEEDAGCVDLPIGRDERSQVFVRLTAGTGLPARTQWQVHGRRDDRTLLDLHPLSGRRHQLRVHMEAIGHPILGDMLYGRPDADYLDLVRGVRDARSAGGGPRRQMLHCAEIEIDLAARGIVRASAPLPVDFVEAWNQPKT